MKKSYLMLAAAAALFAACSGDDLATESPTVAQPTADDGAVMFSAYVNRGVTRAGTPGELTTSTTSDPKISLETVGFGVFGFYTDNEPYSASSKPDFFYNQKVSGAAWTYSPIKYWPNEFGDAAISEGQDKLSFFAYAPWVEVDPNTGIVKGDQKSGIVALTRNTNAGDPYVKYYASMDPDECVDLCWGVAKADFKSSVDGTNNDVDEGYPYVDVVKTKTNDKINFDFQHALASLNVQIDADIDAESHATSSLDSKTKIFVRSVTFNGFTTKGMLNLNSNKSEGPQWFDLAGVNRLSSGNVTVYDGRRDGKEGQTGATATNETPANLNANIISNDGNTNTGVTNTAVNLFDATSATRAIYVIPTEENLDITIVYDVETEDANLAGYISDGKTHGSSVENKITQTIKIADASFKMEAGKAYTVKLHLGLTSVKFEASVTDWVAQTESNVDLPVNSGASMPTVSFGATGGSGNTTDVLGLDASTAVTATPLADWITTVSATNTDAEGKTTVTYTVTENTTLYNRTGAINLSTSSKTSVITVNQAAAALGFTAASYTSNYVTCTISNVTDLSASDINITIKKGDDVISGWVIDGTNKKQINMPASPASGSDYTITIKAGDADPVTQGFSVP